MVVEWYYPIGGIEAFVQRMLLHFPESVEVVLAVQYFGKDVPIKIENPRVTLVTLPKKGVFSCISALLDGDHFDLIHSHHVSMIGLKAMVAGKVRGIPVLLTNHRVPVYRTFTWKDYFIIPVTCLWYIGVNLLPDQIVAPSRTVATLLRKIGVRRSMKVISCGVDTALYVPGLFREKAQTLLYVGRFAQDKNLDTLLDAFAIVRKKYEVNLVMVGSKDTFAGNTWPLINRKVKDLGIEGWVHFPGSMPSDSEELISQFRNADMFVISSYYETQSIVTLEAMASGLPVVASHSGALPELVNDGKSGLLFTSLLPESMAEKIMELMSDTKKRFEMGEHGRKLAENHDIHKTAHEYIALYMKMVTTHQNQG